MTKRACLSLIVACVALLGGAWSSNNVHLATAGAALPPPDAKSYTGILDPVFWRAVPPADRAFAPYEKWTINKEGRPAFPVDVSAVPRAANALANKKVIAYGQYRTATVDGRTVRYLAVTEIHAVP